MRKSNETIEQFRVTGGPVATDSSFGMCGFFVIPFNGELVRAMASDGSDWPFPGQPWEHVSVSLANRCPIWDEMEMVRNLFWHDSETVIQFSVPRDQHINCHPFCLHMWRPIGQTIPLPPAGAVAPSTQRKGK